MLKILGIIPAATAAVIAALSLSAGAAETGAWAAPGTPQLGVASDDGPPPGLDVTAHRMPLRPPR